MPRPVTQGRVAGGLILIALMIGAFWWQGASIVRWLTAPWSGATDHHIPAWMAWHGRLMVAAWAILLPLGTIAARFFKVRPGQDWPHVLDDQRWWIAHRAMQTGGVLLATIGLWLAWRHAPNAGRLAHVHAWLGWGIMVAGWVQIAGGVARGSKGGPTDRAARAPDWHGDHFAMTQRRVWFERAHKGLGYLALAGALVAVPLGLVLADAPRWMWIVIAGWWLLLGLWAVKLQRAGRCIDTYQAIWGPSPDLPGNRMRPIGWGVRQFPCPEGDVRSDD